MHRVGKNHWTTVKNRIQSRCGTTLTALRIVCADLSPTESKLSLPTTCITLTSAYIHVSYLALRNLLFGVYVAKCGRSLLCPSIPFSKNLLKADASGSGFSGKDPGPVSQLKSW